MARFAGLVIRVEISRRGPGSLESAARLQQRLHGLRSLQSYLNATIELRLLQVSQQQKMLGSTNCAPESDSGGQSTTTLHFSTHKIGEQAGEHRLGIGAKSSNSRSSTVYDSVLSRLRYIDSALAVQTLLQIASVAPNSDRSIIPSFVGCDGQRQSLVLENRFGMLPFQRTPTASPDLGR